ncbi:hypothetical protein JAAARDRAFT_58329 [Jaapia argillacea MUCL 33604]|uniref:F-box domain-containing protein n=1 Tax=Jaapia argillacea MUCL 33604 TaxID=933084 RepID=A0A067PSM3_9AGAM|nr:hypothetical protein JAAARDRAFT_58329 [Jaapia argillacea MUCL 33604]
MSELIMKTNTCHPMLEQSDILRLVFEECARDGSNKIKTLASAALCCHSWHDPANDVLWGFQDVVEPYLRTLPGVEEVGDRLTLQTYISEAQWARFIKFAKRARTLYLPDTAVHQCLSHRMAQLSGGQLIFPCLRDLQWIMGDTEDTHWPFLFLSPTLQAVSVHGFADGSRSQQMSAFFDALLRLDRLESLSIKANLDDLSVVGKFTHLVDLNVRQISFSGDRNLFQQLPFLTRLRNLSFNVDGLKVDDNVKRVAMPSVTSLTLEGNATNLARVMYLMKLPLLETIHQFTHGTRSECQSCVSAIPSCFVLTRTIKLRFKVTGLDPGSTTNAFPMIHPLLRVQTLESLTVTLEPNPKRQFRLMDDNFKHMADAWPLLHDIYIAYPLGRPQPTFTTLVTLARRCKSLESISLPIMTTPLPHTREIPLLSHQLDFLGVFAAGVVDDANRAAYFLFKMFPSLQRIVCLEGNGVEEDWEKVAGEYEQLKQVERDILARRCLLG